MSFATGWNREYILHNLTFAQLVRYAEYATEYQIETARLQAIEMGLTLGFLTTKGSSSTAAAPSGNGIDNLIKINNIGRQ